MTLPPYPFPWLSLVWGGNGKGCVPFQSDPPSCLSLVWYDKDADPWSVLPRNVNVFSKNEFTWNIDVAKSHSVSKKPVSIITWCCFWKTNDACEIVKELCGQIVEYLWLQWFCESFWPGHSESNFTATLNL